MSRRALLVDIGAAPLASAARPQGSWVPVVYTPPPLAAPTGLASTAIADAARITWVPTPGAQTIVETAPDVAGAPGAWTVLRTTAAALELLPLPANEKRWVRLQATRNGIVSAYTAAVLASPIVAASQAAVQQAQQDASDAKAKTDIAIDGPTGKIKTGWLLPRKIAGINFDGTADINVPLSGLTGRTLDLISDTALYRKVAAGYADSNGRIFRLYHGTLGAIDTGLVIDNASAGKGASDDLTATPQFDRTNKRVTGFFGEGALARKSAVDFATAEVTNKSSTALSDSANLARGGDNITRFGGRTLDNIDNTPTWRKLGSGYGDEFGRVTALWDGTILRDGPTIGSAVARATSGLDADGTIKAGVSPLDRLTGRTADNIAESVGRKWAAESGATVGALPAEIARVAATERPAPNLISNPSGALEAAGWYGSSAVTAAPLNSFGSYLFAAGPSGATKIWNFDVNGIGAGQVYSLSGEIYLESGAAGRGYIDMAFFDAAGNYISEIGAPINSLLNQWVRLVKEGVATPAGTAKIKARVIALDSFTAINWRRMKLERNAVATPYTEEAFAGTTSLLPSELTAGVHKLGIAGSGKRVGDQRNLPQSNVNTLGSVPSTTALSATAAGAISVNAHTTYMGGSSVAYSAVANAITGKAQSTTWVVYCLDPDYAGGAQTWLAASTMNAAMQAGDGVYIAGIVTIPTSGTGSGGTGGDGDPDLCMDYGSYLPDGRLMRDLVPGRDYAWCVDVRTGERELVQLRAMGEGYEDCYLLASPRGCVIQSVSTPMDLPDGRVVRTPDMLGELVVPWAGGAEPVDTLIYLGRRRVLKPDFGNRMVYAGISPARALATHNARWKP